MKKFPAYFQLPDNGNGDHNRFLPPTISSCALLPRAGAIPTSVRCAASVSRSTSTPSMAALVAV